MRRAARHHPATVFAGAGAEIDQIVGAAQRLLVVLHHQQGVAAIAQPEQRAQQAVVVPLVQADGRFVQHVQHSDERGADLRGKANALRLAARQRGGAAVQGQVRQSDRGHELQAVADLLDDLPCHPGPIAAALLGHAAHVRHRFLHRHGGDPVDAAAGHLHGQRFPAQPPAPASMAGLLAHETFQPPLHVVGPSLQVAALELRDHAAIGGRVAVAGLGGGSVLDLDAVAGPEQHGVQDDGRQLAQGGVEPEAPVPGERPEQRPGPLGPGIVRGDAAFVEGLAGVGNDKVAVELEADPEPGTVRAGAVRVVEREQPGLELRERRAAVRARAGLRESLLRGAGVAVAQHDHPPGAHPQRRLHRAGHPLVQVRPADQAVDHDLDRVRRVPVQLRDIVERVDAAVHPHAHEPRLHRVFEHGSVLPLAAAHHRRQQDDSRTGRHGGDGVDDLVGRPFADGRPAFRAVRAADAGEQQPQVVVDLGHGADRGPWIALRGALLDRDRRRKTVYEVHVRLVQPTQELPGVRRQRLDIAPLPLGKHGVERQ